MSSLQAVVRNLRRASARASAARFAVHAVVAGAAWIVAVLLAARLLPIEQAIRIAAYGLPVAFAAVAVVWIATQPSSTSLMRTADLRLGLKERLSTAWERRQAAGPMDAALQRDALEQAARADLARAFPVGSRRTEFLLAATLLVAAMALLLLPNPMDQVLAQRRADAAAQTRAANAIAAIQKKLATASPTAQVDPQVQKILQDTKSKIASAPDPRTALQNITPAEQQLLQLSDPGTPARVATAQNLASSLSTTNAGRSASQALNASPSQGAQSLRQLASQLPSLSAQDRAELAKALAQAAQQAKDPAMAASLQQAAASLAKGDNAAAAIALNDLAGQLDSLQQQTNNDQDIAAAINGLEASRQQLAAQADRDSASQGQAAGSPAAGAGRSGSGGGSSPGNGSGSGANGSGNGGNGNGGTGGQGSSGSGAGSGTAASSTERVYVPAPPGPGQAENDPTPLAPGQDVTLTPYTQVIQAYQQAALDATDQSLIPGSESDLIRAYFSSLGETASGSGQ